MPLSIINNHANYFSLLRYNKAAHDITIERRAKPSAEIIAFTPLKLDSLNASWFDYEKLDYLFFEHRYYNYFVFTKELNSKKEIYLKIIDTLGKASGFIQLALLEKERNVTDIEFEFKQTQNDNILVIATENFGRFAVKKTAILFDIEKRKITWKKKLPLENDATGFSTAFECNEDGELFYMLVKAHVASYKRKYVNRTQALLPVLFFDSLRVMAFLNSSAFPVKRDLALNNLSALNSIRLIAVKQQLSVIAHFAKQDTTEIINTYFLNQKFNNDLSEVIYQTIAPLDTSIKKSLTFYDGSDYNAASEKEYKHFKNFSRNNYEFQLSERVDEYYYKELISWKSDLENGKISSQNIIPRKIYSFQGRTRFKSLAKAMPFIYNDQLNVVVLENAVNFKKDPNSFNFHQFKKETNLWRANLVMYIVNSEGKLEKKLVYHNSNYDAVPLNYQTNNRQELILYLNGGKSEKFVILQLGQL